MKLLDSGSLRKRKTYCGRHPVDRDRKEVPRKRKSPTLKELIQWLLYQLRAFTHPGG